MSLANETNCIHGNGQLATTNEMSAIWLSLKASEV